MSKNTFPTIKPGMNADKPKVMLMKESIGQAKISKDDQKQDQQSRLKMNGSMNRTTAR